MMEPVSAEQPFPRAALRVGAGTLARHQLALALALNCTRIVCLAHGMSGEVAELQQVAEKSGAQFYLATNALSLAAHVTANDEVLALVDGLYAMPDAVSRLLASGPCVLVQPAEVGLLAGFERIDINHASAGILLVGGHLVERLTELPPDADAISSLTRIALQAGVPQRLVPLEAREAFRWMMVRSEDEAHFAETGSIGHYLASERPASLGAALAWLGVKTFGPALLHANGGGNALAIGGFLLFLLGLGAGWFEAPGVGLLFAGFAWLLHLAAAMLSRVQHNLLFVAHRSGVRATFRGWLLDGVIVAILCWNMAAGASAMVSQRVFASLMLVAMLRLLPRVVAARWVYAATDRFTVAIVLSIAGFSGLLDQVVYVMVGVFAAVGVLVPESSSKLTRA